MPRQKQQISNGGEGPNILEQMEILNAETYDDEAAVSIARSLTELARQRPGPPAHMFGMTGGFEVITERRADVPRVTAERVEVKETKARKARKARGANLGEDEDKGGRRRKKQKLSEDEDGDEDDASKKSRGRPRLDTKDETAADVGIHISLSLFCWWLWAFCILRRWQWLTALRGTSYFTLDYENNICLLCSHTNIDSIVLT